MSSATTSVCQTTEDALAFQVEGQTLIGVLHEPEPAQRSRTGVLVIVGGPQYRVGSHRQFLSLARRLSACGHSTFRFDVRGMGDSTGEPRTFMNVSPDIGAALDIFSARCPHVDRIVLLGLCDGASAALLYLEQQPDHRVGAVCMLNPWVRSEVSLARTHVKHYYLQRLAQSEFWHKLLTGQVARLALTELISNLRKSTRRTNDFGSVSGAPSYQTRMAKAWCAFEGPMLLALSGNDYTAREFEEYVASNASWRNAMARPRLRTVRVAGADHTFSSSTDAVTLATLVESWIDEAVNNDDTKSQALRVAEAA